MLPVTASSIRLFLHVLGATVWVGGQLTLGALIPAVRRQGTDAVRAVARRFQLVAWPAYALLVATGIWNLYAVHAGERSAEWLTTLAVKLAFVALSGLAAAAHILVAAPRVRRAPDETTRRKAAAVSGALEGGSVVFALAAAFLGVLLRG